MLYSFLKAIVSLGVRLYYREIKVINRHYLEEDGPSIIIGNHPNTLMDAWMMGFINRKKIYFMAKATFFSNPLKRKLLHGLGMIPVNRKTDTAVGGVSNKDSFEACYKLLENGNRLVIFPEGTSYLERQLRELKTGTARIGLEVERRTQGRIPLKVIPVGLNYIDGENYRGRVQVCIGKPIELNEYWEAFEKEPGRTAKEVTELFRIALTRVFVSLENDQNEQLVEEILDLFDTKYSNQGDQVSNSVEFMKTCSNKIEEMQLTQAWKISEIREKMLDLRSEIKSLGLQSDFLDRPFRKHLFVRQNIQSMLFLILCFPFFLLGFVHHVLPYWLIGKLVTKITKEVEYHAPITVILGLFLYPINYLLIGICAAQLVDLTWWKWCVYLLSIPFFGVFAHFYLRYLRHVIAKGKFRKFAVKDSIVFEELKSKREVLRKLIFE